MKRVLFVDHVDRVLGGAEINLIELLEEAKRRGQWDMAVACRAGSRLGLAVEKLGIRQFDYGFPEGLNALRFTGKTFPWLRILRGWLALRAGAKRLRAINADFPSDFVITCTNKDHIAAEEAGIVPSRRVSWVNDLMTPDFFSLPTRRVFAGVANRAGRLVAVSNAVAGALENLRIPREKIAVIHNGIPVQKYRGAAKGAFRAEYGFPSDQPLFGVVGRICEWKGQLLFADVARRWIEAGLPGNFVVIGQAFNEDQPYAEKVRAAADALGARVRIVPFQEDVAAALADLDALMHTSIKPEPFGRVLIEAMAAGAPVVAANAGGAREVVEENVTGLLATPGDANDYFEKLRALMTNAEPRSEMARRAQISVSEKFSVERVCSDFEKIVAGSK
jgi:glycosyltransferase involved in cell wall biosynthesis